MCEALATQCEDWSLDHQSPVNAEWVRWPACDLQSRCDYLSRCALRPHSQALSQDLDCFLKVLVCVCVCVVKADSDRGRREMLRENTLVCEEHACGDERMPRVAFHRCLPSFAGDRGSQWLGTLPSRLDWSRRVLQRSPSLPS